jgi:hypothetical protein
MISLLDTVYLFTYLRVSVRNVSAAAVIDRRLTGCAITEMEQADADQPRAPARQAQVPNALSRLQRAVRDQLSFGIGRRWSRGLTFRSVQVPEMLDQAASCEGICEICRVVIEWGRM